MSMSNYHGGRVHPYRSASSMRTYQTIGKVGNLIGRTLKNYWTNRKKTAPQKKRKYSTSVGHESINEGVGGGVTEFVLQGPVSTVSKAVLAACAPQAEVFNTQGQLLVTPGVQANILGLTLADQSAYNAVTSSSKNQRAVLTKAYGKLKLANNFKANCFVTIWDICAKENIPLSNISDPLTAWTKGLTDESLTNTVNTVGACPYDTDTFTSFYKVVRRTEIVIPGGGVHEHRIKWKGSKLVKGPEGAYNAGFRNTTIWTIITITGQPAHDSTTKTNVTLGSGGLDIIVESEHIWKILATATQTISRSNNLATSFAVGEAEAFVGGTTTGTNAEA